jgi:hypothetical protein
MTDVPNLKGTVVHFASRAKYVRNVLIGMGLSLLFALFHFIPYNDQPALRIFGYMAFIFSSYLTAFSALYVVVRRPSLILDQRGLQYRVSVFKTVLVPWGNISRVAIESSSASYRGKDFVARFISIYPHDKTPVVRALPLVQRFFSWVSTNMGFAPLSFADAMAEAPLEVVLGDIRRCFEAFATPNKSLHTTALSCAAAERQR